MSDSRDTRYDWMTEEQLVERIERLQWALHWLLNTVIEEESDKSPTLKTACVHANAILKETQEQTNER